MSVNPELAKLEPLDVVLIKHWGYDGDALFMAKVVRRTATRLTVLCNAYESTWTLDGVEYPKPTGYNRRRSLLPVNDANMEQYRRDRALRRVRNLHHKFGEIVKSNTMLSNLTEVELRNLGDALEKCILSFGAINVNETDPL